MAKIGEFLDQVKNEVDLTLDSLIPSGDEEPTNLHSAIRWSVFAGGKRVRPAILIAVGAILRQMLQAMTKFSPARLLWRT